MTEPEMTKPDVTEQTKPNPNRPDTPFPRHWKYYIVLKYAVLAVAVLLALYVAVRLT